MNNPESLPTIAVVGCGYVGLTTAVLLANCGYRVYAVEINPERLQVIQSGRSFFYEPGVNELLSKALQAGNFTATDSYPTAIPDSDFILSCVGTPDNADGSSNMSFVFDAANSAADLMKDSAIFVQKSTVPVGTGKKVQQAFQEKGKTNAYVSNPEFLREGTAIVDTLWPDRVVAGSDNVQAAQAVLALYKHIEECRNDIVAQAGVKPPATSQATTYVSSNLNSAELIKVTANAFLALKISFANSIAKLADSANADIVEVMDAVGADRRIGRAFLNAGRGYGGGCFPKDVSGLIRSAEDYGVDMEIMKAAVEVNDSMPHYIIAKAEKALGSSFAGKTVAVLGLAFKAGTSDARRSPAIAIANTLASQGATVRAYDPEAMEEAKPSLDPAVQLSESAAATVQGADCVFVATDWPEFKDIDWQAIKAKLIVDCMNYLDASKFQNSNIIYKGVGQ